MDASFARYSTTRTSTASDPQVFIGVILLLRVPLSTVVTAGLWPFITDICGADRDNDDL